MSTATTSSTEIGVRADTRLMFSEIDGVLTRMCDQLIVFAYPNKGRATSHFRTAVGYMLANIEFSLYDGTLPDQMLEVFNAAVTAGIQVFQIDPVLKQLWSEFPHTLGAEMTKQTSVLFALSAQCKIIADMTFKSRDDIDAMQKRMKSSFDMAKEMAADDMDNIIYIKLVDLAAKLARHLAASSLALPRIVYYSIKPLPGLAMSYRIYADASRTEEIIAENKVVHPLFVRSQVRALSA